MWAVEQARVRLVVVVFMSVDISSGTTSPDQVSYNQKTCPCYPQTLEVKPDIPSPYTTRDGTEIVTAFTRDGRYALIPVTVENGDPLNYKQRQRGKGRQLQADAGDFPTLAQTGLHSQAELSQTKTITGRAVAEITEFGRPGRSSGAALMSHDEDIIPLLNEFSV